MKNPNSHLWGVGLMICVGDSHANWVSDLVWLDTHPYDQTTGAGSIGVGMLPFFNAIRLA